MFNMSSPQDQVSNFILNKAYSGQTYMLKFRIKLQFMKTKLSINSVTSSIKAF